MFLVLGIILQCNISLSNFNHSKCLLWCSLICSKLQVSYVLCVHLLNLSVTLFLDAYITNLIIRIIDVILFFIIVYSDWRFAFVIIKKLIIFTVEIDYYTVVCIFTVILTYRSYSHYKHIKFDFKYRCTTYTSLTSNNVGKLLCIVDDDEPIVHLCCDTLICWYLFQIFRGTCFSLHCESLLSDKLRNIL